MDFPMNRTQVTELILQSLEHERGGVKIYKSAVAAAARQDLKAEWTHYLEQTEQHVQSLTEICEVFAIDPLTATPGTEIVKANGAALLQAIEKARAAGNPQAAQLVAAECVVLAETKDHMNWELLGEVAKELSGGEREVVSEAFERIEDEEDEHLYHTQGWARELWLESLGLPAELPPREEKLDVTSATEAQQAKETRQPRH
jgi:protein-disulfide isomerase-like protein with CxxC motif